MQPSVKKNFVYRTIYEILLLLTPFITTPYVSRVLGGDGVGIYSYTSSIMTFFTMVATLGTATYGQREIAQHRDNKAEYSKLFWEIELISVITSTFTLIVWLLLSAFYLEYRIYLYALTPLLLGTMFDINWFFMGHEKVIYTVLRNSAVKIAGIVLLFVFVKEKSDLTLYIALQSIVTLLGSLSMWTYLPRMLAKVNFRTLQFKNHFKQTLVYFIPTIATTMYTVINKTLLGIITHDNFQNGYYEQASKLIRIVNTFVFSSVNTVMSARMSYLYSQKKYGQIKQGINKSLDFIFLLGVASVFGIIGITHRFVPVFFGPGFEPVELLIYLMLPLVLIIGVSHCLGCQYYTPSGRRAESARYIITGSCVNLLLNLSLIPFFQAKGAVVASVIAELVITILYIKNCNGFLKIKDILSLLWKRIIAGTIMAIIVFLVGAIQINSISIIFLQVFIGILVYVILLKTMRDKMLEELISIAICKIKGIFMKIRN